MARPKSNPLLKALFDRLPKNGEEFDVDRQLAWLNMAALTLGIEYGGDVAARFGARDLPAAAKPAAPPKPAPKPEPSYPFIIDKEGFARNGKTKTRVVPGEVTSELYDLRGMDGDMATIVWGDGSTGLNGADLSIVAA